MEELGAGDNSWLHEAKSLSEEGKKQGRLQKDDSEEVNKLLADARRLQADLKGAEQKSRPSDLISSSAEKKEKKEDSDDEAEVLMQQIRDGMAFEDAAEERETVGKQTVPSKGDDDIDEELRKRFAALEKLSLPPAPTGLPTGSLGLPLAPTSKPVPKGKRKTVEQKVDELMDDLEHWCCKSWSMEIAPMKRLSKLDREG